MAGTFARSAGVLLLSIPEFLKVYDLSEIESIKLLFTFYSIIGIVIIFIYIRLSDKVEFKLKEHYNTNIKTFDQNSVFFFQRNYYQTVDTLCH